MAPGNVAQAAFGGNLRQEIRITTTTAPTGRPRYA
jgi:hypothetical protein